MTELDAGATQRRRAKRTSPGERRRQILRAATEVFGRQGYRQGSLKAVADEVGLTIQGLLHYFPTKEELLFAVLRNHDNETRAEIDRTLANEGALETCRLVLSKNLENPDFIRLYVTVAAEATDPQHPAHQHFLVHYQSTHKFFTQQLRADAAQGRLPDGLDPAATSSELIALMDGLQLQYLLRPAMDLLGTFDRVTRSLHSKD